MKTESCSEHSINLPEFPDTFWSFKHALPFIRKKAPCRLSTFDRRRAAAPEWESAGRPERGKLTQKDLSWPISRSSAHGRAKGFGAPGCRSMQGSRSDGRRWGPLFIMEHEEFETVDHFVLNEGELTLPVF